MKKEIKVRSVVRTTKEQQNSHIIDYKLAYVQDMAVTHRNYLRIKENKNSKRKKTQEIW